MIVILEQGAGLAVHRVGCLERLRTRMRASRLDRKLADGASPEGSVALAIRARVLAQPSEGARLADALERIVGAADPSSSSRLKVPVNRQAVRAAGTELRAIIDLLRSGPVDVRTIATIRNLVAQGNSPLYRLDTTGDLRAELLACVPAATS
ncbi:MAG: hypothetical protein WBG41_11055 [Acidimicrobiales bacterium]